jgi:predicted nucleic acid-binding protein
VTTYLLDANVIIALTVAEHLDHDRASAWVGGVGRFASCPIVEGALDQGLARTSPDLALLVPRI